MSLGCGGACSSQMTRPRSPDHVCLSSGTVQAIVADRRYRGLAKMAAKRGLRLDIKAPAEGDERLHADRPLYRVEHAFARLGRWRRLSRCHEGSAASARAWLEVASLAYLVARLRVEPA